MLMAHLRLKPRLRLPLGLQLPERSVLLLEPWTMSNLKAIQLRTRVSELMTVERSICVLHAGICTSLLHTVGLSRLHSCVESCGMVHSGGTATTRRPCVRVCERLLQATFPVGATASRAALSSFPPHLPPSADSLPASRPTSPVGGKQCTLRRTPRQQASKPGSSGSGVSPVALRAAAVHRAVVYLTVSSQAQTQAGLDSFGVHRNH